jgi:hypothetical protein
MHDEQAIWLTLAELFFLDAEPQQADFERALALLREAGWSRKRTRKTLIELIAPTAGANLGFLVWPVIGEWMGFDKASLCSKIHRTAALREKYPKWYFFLSDWWCARMLQDLEVERLLDQI